MLRGRRVRRSLDTTSWERANDRIRTIEQTLDDLVITLADAIRVYMRDCEARNLRASTLRNYRRTFETLTDVQPKILLAELTEQALRGWRETLDCAPATARQHLVHIRGFCAWCQQRGWLTNNPATHIKPPRVDSPGALPYTREELAALHGAIDGFGRGQYREYSRLRIRAILLLLLHSGLRLSDAIMLRRDTIVGQHLILRTTLKTGTPIKILLPQSAIDALEALPLTNEYFFGWNPERTAAMRIEFRTALRFLGKRAGVANCHPHRFRDTFAVFLLEAGADIRTVSLMLGHSSIKTTEKHYAHFVAAHQARLDSAAGALDFGL